MEKAPDAEYGSGGKLMAAGGEKDWIHGKSILHFPAGPLWISYFLKMSQKIPLKKFPKNIYFK